VLLVLCGVRALTSFNHELNLAYKRNDPFIYVVDEVAVLS